MIRIYLFVLFLVVACNTSMAQKVTGKITSATDGKPIYGAVVLVKGHNNTAVLSDVEGVYSINIPDNVDKVIEVSFVGYKPQTIQVTKAQHDVVLATEIVGVQELVVVAYGKVNREAYTGSAAVVDKDKLKNLQVSTPTGALQGMASGVMVVNTNGQPGNSPTVRIRGVGSFAASNDPLYIVDGVPYNGNLNTLPSQNIESMTVLKDASSVALYGSRAANGVVMITTKSGSERKTTVNYKSQFGFSTRARQDYDLLGSREFLELNWQAFRNDYYYNGKTGYPNIKGDKELAAQAASEDLMRALVYNPFGNNPDYAQPVGTDGRVINAPLLYEDDWQKALTRTGTRQEHELSLHGGNQKVTWMLSAGLLDEKGVTIASDFKRMNINGKFNAKAYDWLMLGLSTGVSIADQNTPIQGGSSYENVIGFARNMPRIYPIYLRGGDGEFVNLKGEPLGPDESPIADFGDMGYHPGGWIGNASNYSQNWRPVYRGANPVGSKVLDKINNRRLNNFSNAFAEVKFLKDFTAKTQLGLEIYTISGLDYQNPQFGAGKLFNGGSTRNIDLAMTTTWINTLSWDKKFMNKHHINILVGSDAYDYNIKALSGTKRGFYLPNYTELSYGIDNYRLTSSNVSKRNMRYMSRVNYDLAGKYHFSATFALDGVSVFAQDNRWGSFYSVGGSWNVNKEKFWKDLGINRYMNSLKLRLSYGTTGNSNISSPTPYLDTYALGYNVMDYGGMVPSSLGNPNLTWEKQKQVDAGVDMSLLNSRINIGLTYFNRTSSDLLMNHEMAESTGYNGYYDNIGKIRNQGWELDFNSYIISKHDLNLSFGFNISRIRNKVLALPEDITSMVSPLSGSKILEVGKSAYTWYMQEFAGIDPANGMPMWYRNTYDAAGKATGKEITYDYGTADKYQIEDALPKFSGGFNINFTWKNLSISTISAFSIGGSILDTDYSGLMHGFNSGSTGFQSVAEAANAWKKPGDVTNVAVLSRTPTNFNAMSTRWLVDASYLRLRNVTVGYNFNKFKWLQKVNCQSINLFCAVDNLVTIFGTKGLDPEQGLNAVTNNTSSVPRTVSFGLKIEF